MNNNNELALSLLENPEKCNVDYINKYGETAFLWACYNSMSEVALKMIDVFGIQGCKPEQVTNGNGGETAFIWTCCNNMSDVALKMIDVFGAQGCKPEQVDNNGNTALIWACYNRMSEVALRMIDVFGAQGCKLEQVNDGGCTALIWACYNSMSDVALKMIDVFGANCKLDQIKHDGLNAFHFACLNNMTTIIPLIFNMCYRKYFTFQHNNNDNNILNQRNAIIKTFVTTKNYVWLYHLLTTYSTTLLCSYEQRRTICCILFTNLTLETDKHYHFEKCVMLVYGNNIMNTVPSALTYIQVILDINRHEKEQTQAAMRVLHYSSSAIKRRVFYINELLQLITDFIYTDYEPAGRGHGHGLCI